MSLKAVGAGTATITCKTVDGGKTATCKVNVDGWVNSNGKYSYVKDGKKLTGFYYFTSKEGEKTPHWSYFDKNGVVLTGWQEMGKGTNNPDNNKARHWSFFGDNGWLRTGKQTINKKAYTFNDAGWLTNPTKP